MQYQNQIEGDELPEKDQKIKNIKKMQEMICFLQRMAVFAALESPGSKRTAEPLGKFKRRP